LFAGLLLRVLGSRAASLVGLSQVGEQFDRAQARQNWLQEHLPQPFRGLLVRHGQPERWHQAVVAELGRLARCQWSTIVAASGAA
jgi:hypothetical protein